MIRIITAFNVFLFVTSIPQLNKTTCSPSEHGCRKKQERSTEWQDFLDLSLIGTVTKQKAYPTFDEATGNLKMHFFACEPFNTCVGRCIHTTDLHVNYPPYTCHCDPECENYNDCCGDYRRYCLKQNSTAITDFNNRFQFSCIDLNGNYGILIVDKCGVKWDDENIRLKCESEPIDPLTDSDGIVYKNKFCSLCNDANQDNTEHWEQRECKDSETCTIQYMPPIKSKFIPRKCVYDIGTCPSDFPSQTYQNIVSMCQAYTGMVLGKHSEDEDQVKYKNPHCAMCNNASEVTCPQWRWSLHAVNRLGTQDSKVTHWASKLYGIHNKTPPIDVFEVGLLQKQLMVTTAIPPAVSILFNFGLNGRKNFYFSSNPGMQAKNNNCPSNHIWDPFLDICRRLSCNANFTLVDYQCVETNYNETEKNALSDLIFGINLNKVVICLAFQVNKVVDQTRKNVTQNILNNLRYTLGSTLGINTNRLSNVILINKKYITGLSAYKRTASKHYEKECAPLLAAFDFSHRKNIALRFELSDPEPQFVGFEPSTDRIVSLLMTSVNLNTMSLVLDGYTLRLLGIHEETIVDGDDFRNWCVDGEKSKYMNNEFVILNSSIYNEDWKMVIYINETGKTYKKGEYLANFISIGNSQSKLDHINSVNGIVIVCENRSKLTSQLCTRLELLRNEYEFLRNGSIKYKGELPIGKTILDIGEYEMESDGNFIICYNITNSELVLVFDPIQAYLGLIATSISLLAMAITFFTYCLFSKLRNLPGMNLMNLVLILFLSQLTYLIGIRCNVKSLACKIVAIVIHYEILCSFFWTNVMAYDLYKTFGNTNILPFTREKKNYLKYYMAYAYLSPAAVVSIPIAIDTCKCTGSFEVGYGDMICGISNNIANVVFFGLPIAILLVINFIFYVITICSIRKIKKIVKATTYKRGENDVNLYVRMSSVMGFTWVFLFAAQFTANCCPTVSTVFTYIFVLTYSLQGLFICWAFVCNKRIFNLYKPYGLRIWEIMKVKLISPSKEKELSQSKINIDSISPLSSRSGSLLTSRSQLSDN